MTFMEFKNKLNLYKEYKNFNIKCQPNLEFNKNDLFNFHLHLSASLKKIDIVEDDIEKDVNEIYYEIIEIENLIRNNPIIGVSTNPEDYTMDYEYKCYYNNLKDLFAIVRVTGICKF